MNRLERLENLSAYIDGELDSDETRRLAAWCEGHPEDVQEYEALAEVVRQIRGLPAVEPPVGLRESILRAVAEAAPVEASRDQAVEWLDAYFDDELSEPRRAVVEHYLAADPEFAELAELHAAMLTALSDVDEAEPPADLRERIAASVAAGEPAPRKVPPRMRRRGQIGKVAAAAAVLAVVLWAGMRSGQSGPVEVAKEPPAIESPAPAPAPAPSPMPQDQLVEVTPLDATPELPVNDAAEPVVPDGMDHQPAPAPERPAVNPRETDNLATNERAPRRPVTPAPRRRTTSPTNRRPAERTAPQTNPTADKKSPQVTPARPPAETTGGMLASPTGSGATKDVPEMIQRSGNGSVLGSDMMDGTGVGEGDEAGGLRGSLDPTRRIEAPPF